MVSLGVGQACACADFGVSRQLPSRRVQSKLSDSSSFHPWPDAFLSAFFLIFSFQIYYLLLLFGVEINYFAAMATISSMYLLSSIIPSIFIFDLIIKGGVSVYLFGLIGIHEAIILAIVTLMWILNFVLPSVIGSYHVLNFKLPKTVS